jgi:rare lipoprotein A (peptidoglycan hydrolase)
MKTFSIQLATPFVLLFLLVIFAINVPNVPPPNSPQESNHLVKQQPSETMKPEINNVPSTGKIIRTIIDSIIKKPEYRKTDIDYSVKVGEEPPEGMCSITNMSEKWLYPNPKRSKDPYTIRRKAEKRLYNCKLFKSNNPEVLNYLAKGIASWYGENLFHGKKTSTGIVYDQYKLTTAHKTLPGGALMSITNEETGKSSCALNIDKGPFHGDRIIDLSYQLAKNLGLHKKGTATVTVDVKRIIPLKDYKSGKFKIPKTC